MPDQEVQVTDEPRHQRYVATIDGQVAGFAAYERGAGEIEFTHTVVDDAYEGHGVGSKIASTALGEARAAGLKVIPVCPFFAGYIKRHPEWADLVAG